MVNLVSSPQLPTFAMWCSPSLLAVQKRQNQCQSVLKPEPSASVEALDRLPFVARCSVLSALPSSHLPTSTCAPIFQGLLELVIVGQARSNDISKIGQASVRRVAVLPDHVGGSHSLARNGLITKLLHHLPCFSAPKSNAQSRLLLCGCCRAPPPQFEPHSSLRKPVTLFWRGLPRI